MGTYSKTAAAITMAAFLSAGAVNSVNAQTAFPTKPIVAIVPFSPGGGNDILLRLISKHANEFLGQTLVVENKPGAGGQIGWTALAKSKADGYTIGATSLPSMVIIKAMRPATPFALDDFRYICNIQVDPVIWVVKADSRFKTAKEFVAQASNPQKVINIAGDGPQSNVQLQHLAAAKALGLSTNFVSFSGSGPAVTALLGGQVEIAATTLSSAIPNIEAGKLRALVVFSSDPVLSLPDVPTASKLFGKAIPSVGMAVRGLAVPKGVPDDAVAKLEGAFKQLSDSKAFLAEAKNLGIMVKFMNAAEAEALVKESAKEVDALKDLLK
ncbi:MAG: tripartite tricarboxylate transporter substrate binding protein [Burkholderiales bacterium]|nr:tripartite tricarboxylate transporter substrate binding protein [Burkholderiales bacterium]